MIVWVRVGVVRRLRRAESNRNRSAGALVAVEASNRNSILTSAETLIGRTLPDCLAPPWRLLWGSTREISKRCGLEGNRDRLPAAL